jgi:hypothetical protein
VNHIDSVSHSQAGMYIAIKGGCSMFLATKQQLYGHKHCCTVVAAITWECSWQVGAVCG